MQIIINILAGIGALTDENCIFVAERGTCTGCPIAEEAEKRGYR